MFSVYVALSLKAYINKCFIFLSSFHTFWNVGLVGRQTMSSSLTNQLTVSKIRLFSFFIGLALILLIIASYGVLWYHKGFLFTPTPYQPSPMVAAQRKSEEELTPKNVKLDMKSLMSTIGSKIDYSPRSIPKQEELVEIDTLVGI